MSPSVLYLFLIDLFLLKCSGIGMLGPADIIFKSFGICDPESSDINLKIASRKYNRTITVLDIDIFASYDLDNSVVLEINAAIKKEGGYKPGAFYMKDNYCTVFKTLMGDLFDTFLKKAGRDECPIPKGTYEIRDFYLDNDQVNTQLLYGDYKAEAKLYKDEVLTACYYFILETVPKGQ